MDLATPLGPLAAAPTGTDNATVILWVVMVLIVVVVALAGLLLAQIRQERGERLKQVETCRQENERAWSRVEERDHALLELTREAQKAMGENSHALTRMTDAVDGLTDAIRRSGHHETRP